MYWIHSALILSFITSIGESSKCLSSIKEIPKNSFQLILFKNPEKDEVIRVCVCKFGYLYLDDGVTINMYCSNGDWYPNTNNPVSCKPKRVCGGLWNPVGESCYLLTRAKDWDFSKKSCSQYDSEFLTLDSDRERGSLTEALKYIHHLPKRLQADLKTQALHLWLGLSDLPDHENWTWIESEKRKQLDPRILIEHDKWRNFAYLKIHKNGGWQFESATNNMEHPYIREFYTVCKKKSGNYISKQLNEGNSRVIFVDDNSPLTIRIGGLKKLMTQYLFYEWAPSNLDRQYLESNMISKLLTSILSDGGMYDGNVFIELDNIILEKVNEMNPEKPDKVYSCKQNDIENGVCGFKVYSALNNETEIEFFWTIENYITARYILEMTYIGLKEELFIYAVESDGVTSWTPWSKCFCESLAFKTIRERHRLCVSFYDQLNYLLPCQQFKGPADVQRIECFENLCIESYSYVFTPWSVCDAECGSGQQWRIRLCDMEIKACAASGGLERQYRSCSISCEDDYSIILEDWLNSPDRQIEYDNLMKEMRGSIPSAPVYSKDYRSVLCFSLLLHTTLRLVPAI